MRKKNRIILIWVLIAMFIYLGYSFIAEDDEPRVVVKTTIQSQNKTKDKERMDISIEQYNNEVQLSEEELEQYRIYYDTPEEALANSNPKDMSEYPCLKVIEKEIKRFQSEENMLLFYTTKHSTEKEFFCLVMFKLKYENGKTKYAFYSIEPGAYTRWDIFGSYDAAFISRNLQLRNYMPSTHYNPDKNFHWGVTRETRIYNLRIEGQSPTEIIPVEILGNQEFFWYYDDIQSEKPITEWSVEYEGETAEDIAASNARKIEVVKKFVRNIILCLVVAILVVTILIINIKKVMNKANGKESKKDRVKDDCLYYRTSMSLDECIEKTKLSENTCILPYEFIDRIANRCIIEIAEDGQDVSSKKRIRCFIEFVTIKDSTLIKVGNITDNLELWHQYERKVKRFIEENYDAVRQNARIAQCKGGNLWSGALKIRTFRTKVKLEECVHRTMIPNAGDILIYQYKGMEAGKLLIEIQGRNTWEKPQGISRYFISFELMGGETIIRVENAKYGRHTYWLLYEDQIDKFIEKKYDAGLV